MEKELSQAIVDLHHELNESTIPKLRKGVKNGKDIFRQNDQQRH